MGKENNKNISEAERRLQWLKEARFGMFIVWGVYALLAGEWKGNRIGGLGEQIMYCARIPVKDYEEIPKKFNPEKFNADEWVKLAKDAGMRYLVITAKFCDGFAMYHSKVTKYNIVDSTSFKRDPMKELEDACIKHGVRLGFYYSHNWDWHEPDALGLLNDWDFKDKSERHVEKYLNGKSLPQMEELVTQYSPHIIWFDVPCELDPYGESLTKEQSQSFIDVIRKHLPDCIVNERVGNGLGDYGTPEQYIPSSGGQDLFEVCMTMNDTWGYKKYDHNWKSAEIVIRNLVDIASKGGNYLLNVGPTDEGLIPEASVRILQEVGKWIQKYGDSIYGAEGSLLGALPYGRCTVAKDRLYIHIFQWPDSGRIIIPGIQGRIKKAYMLADPKKRSLKVEYLKNMDIIVDIHARDFSAEYLDLVDTVLTVEYEGQLDIDKTTLLFEKDYKTFFEPADALINGTTLKYELNDVYTDERDYITRNWSDINDSMSWNFRVGKEGEFDVEINYAAPIECNKNEFRITVGNTDIPGKVNETGGWFKFKTFSLGKINFTSIGKHKLSIKPVCVSKSSLMNLKSVILKPIDM